MQNLAKVNLSSSFFIRARCSRCGQKPLYYFYSRNPVLWYDPNKSKNIFDLIKRHYKRFSVDEFIINHIRDAAKIGYYNHSVNYKGYKPKLHRTRGVNPVFDFVEFLTCNCGYSIWSFAEKSIANRKEINNRKARYNF